MPGVSFDQQSARRIADATRKIERLSVDLTGRTPRVLFDDGWVSFKNVGTETVPAWGVVRVNSDAAVQVGDTHSIILQCEQPNDDFTRTYAVNSSEEVPAGQYGRCRLPPFNHVEVLYNADDTPEFDQGWGPKPGSFKLFPFYPQTATVLSVLSGIEGAETLLCNWQTIDSVRVQLTAELAYRDSASSSVIVGERDDESVIPDMVLEVFDGYLNSGDTLADLSIAAIRWENGIATVVSAGCEPADELSPSIESIMSDGDAMDGGDSNDSVDHTLDGGDADTSGDILDGGSA